MELYKPPGLRRYVNGAVLDQADIKKFLESGVADASVLRDFCGAQPAPETVSWVTDQEQTQLTGGQFIIDELLVNGVGFHDWFHRMNNDLWDSIARSGLMPVADATTFIYNVGYGPWQSAAWFHSIEAQLNYTAESLEPDSPMLLKFWPRIVAGLRRHHETADDLVGNAARSQFIEDMRTRSSIQMKCVKVKRTQWMSWNMAHDMWSRPTDKTSSCWSEKAMVLGMWSLNKGHIATVEDLFAGCKGSDIDIERRHVGSKADAVRSAAANLRQLKERNSHALAAAAKLMADVDVMFAAELLATGSRAIYSEFVFVVENLKSEADSKQLAIGWSQSSWLEALKGTLRCREDLVALEACGFRVTFPDSYVRRSMTPDGQAEVAYQNSRAAVLNNFVMLNVGKVAGSMSRWVSQYPFCLAGALSEDSLGKTMAAFRDDAQAYWTGKASYM